MTFFCAGASLRRRVGARRSWAVFASLPSTAPRRFLIAVRMRERCARLRARSLTFCRFRFSADLVFAIVLRRVLSSDRLGRSVVLESQGEATEKRKSHRSATEDF